MLMNKGPNLVCLLKKPNLTNKLNEEKHNGCGGIGRRARFRS